LTWYICCLRQNGECWGWKLLSTHLVEATDQDPELLVVHATDERSGNLLRRLIPAQVLDFGIVGELCDSLHVDIGLGKGMTGCGFFGQILGGFRRGACRRRCINRIWLGCWMADGVQVLVDDTSARSGF